MALDPRLLEILVCPACHASVQYKERRKVVVCDGCAKKYPVREHIPIMLVSEAS